jgi:uncharacterized protein (DUF302 family)
MESFQTIVPLSLADARRAVRDALATEGFGVLTEIDVAANLKASLGVDRAPLVILGACNPTLANGALELETTVALVMPCNVVLEQDDDGTQVRVVDPQELMDDPRFVDLADQAARQLRRALDTLSRSVAR